MASETLAGMHTEKTRREPVRVVGNDLEKSQLNNLRLADIKRKGCTVRPQP